MAKGKFTAETTSRDGSRLEVKKLSEANTLYRFIPTTQAIAITQADKTVEEVDSLFGGTFTVSDDSPGQITGTVDIYRNADDPAQSILVQAHNDNDKVNLRETTVGKKVTENAIAAVSGDSIALSAPTATKPYGEIDVSGSNANKVAMRSAIAGVGRGATIKVGSTQYFVGDYEINSAGQITTLRITPGSGRSVGNFSDWNNAAVAAISGSIDIFNTRTYVREYVATVTSLPQTNQTAGSTGGLDTATVGLTFDDGGTLVAVDPS